MPDEPRIYTKGQRENVAAWLDQAPWGESNTMMRMGLTRMESVIRNLLATCDDMENDAELGKALRELKPHGEDYELTLTISIDADGKKKARLLRFVRSAGGCLSGDLYWRDLEEVIREYEGKD